MLAPFHGGLAPLLSGILDPSLYSSVFNQIKGLSSMTPMAGLCEELLFAVYKYDGA